MRPCPFCKRPAGVTRPWIQARIATGAYRVECLFCGACGPWAYSEEEAVRKWEERE